MRYSPRARSSERARLTLIGLIAALVRLAYSKPCRLQAKTSRKTRLVDAARHATVRWSIFFFWILDSIFGHGHYAWADLAITNRVPMPNEPHELTLFFTKENPVS